MEPCIAEKGKAEVWGAEGADTEGRTQTQADAKRQNLRLGDLASAGQADRWREESADRWADDEQMDGQMDRPRNRYSESTKQYSAEPRGGRASQAGGPARAQAQRCG